MLSRLFPFWGRLKLKKKITIIVCLVCGMSVFLCCAALAYINYQDVQKLITQEIEGLYQRQSSLFEEYIENMNTLAYTVMYSNWAQDLLNKKYINNATELETNRKNINHFLSSLSSISHDIRIILFSDGTVQAQNYSDYLLRYDFNVEKMPWYNQMLQDGVYRQFAVPDEIFYRVSEPMLCFFYPAKSNYSHRNLGCLMLGIDLSALRSFESRYQDHYTVLITDESGHPLLHQSEMSNIPSLDKPSLYRGKIAVDGWYFDIRQGDSITRASWFERYKNLLVLMIPAFIFGALLIGFFSQYLTKPILACKNATISIRNHDLSVRIDNEPYHDEIGELITGLNEMTTTIASLIDQNHLIYLLKRDAELEMLQQKVDPHFLYNSLEIINSLILDHDYAKAMRLCEIIGLMFRYNLDNRKWVTVQNECDQICLYLEILNERNRGIDFDCSIEDTVRTAKIPKMILQPIVENSLKHGLLSRREGCISLQISQEHDKVFIRIMDNGIGMTQQELSSLLAYIKAIELPEDTISDNRQGASPHFGLRNIYQRLTLEYNGDFTFEMESVSGSGTRTDIRIPMKESADS